MALAAVDEAYRAHIALGGDPAGAVALDNFCWPDPVESPANPDGAYKLAQLVRACEALREACLAYGLPLVSGKDSMKNDAFAGGRRISVAPTLLVTLVGIIDDVRKAPSTDFLAPGDLIYVVGATGRLLGASILERAIEAPAGAPGRLPAEDRLLGPCPVADPAEHLRDLQGDRQGRERPRPSLDPRPLRRRPRGRGGGVLPGRPARRRAAPRRDAASRNRGGRYVRRGRPPLRRGRGPLPRLDTERGPRALRAQHGGPAPRPRRRVTSREPRLRARLGGEVILDAALDELERAYKTPIA